MPELLLVAQSADVPFSTWLDDSTLASVVHFKRGDALRLSLLLAQQVQIPAEVLSPDKSRLLTFEEMRRAVVAAGSALEEQWHQALKTLSTLQLKVDAGGTAVLENVAFLPSGAAVANASLTLNVREFLTRNAPLKASLVVNASCDIVLPGGALHGSLRFELVVEGQVPQFTIGAGDFPFRLPAFPLPDFDWNLLDPAHPVQLPWPSFRLPALPFLPVKVQATDVQFTGSVNAGKLEFTLVVPSIELSIDNGSPVAWGSLNVTQSNGILTYAFVVASPALQCPPFQKTLPAPLDALELDVSSASLHLCMRQNGTLFGWLDTAFSIRSLQHRNRFVTVAAVLPFDGSALTQSVPNPAGGPAVEQSVKLKDANVDLDFSAPEMPDFSGSLSIKLGWPQVPSAAMMKVLQNLAALLAEILEGMGRTASGIGEAVGRGLQALASLMFDALQGLDVIVVIDRRSGNLEQVVLGVHRAAQAAPATWSGAGFTLSVPSDLDLSVLVDLRGGRSDAYLVASADSGPGRNLATLGADLWLGTPTHHRPAGELDPPTSDSEPFIKLTVSTPHSATRVSVIPFGLRAGRATFLQAVTPAIPPVGGISPTLSPFELTAISDKGFADFKFNLDKARKLPFLSSPADSAGEEGGGIGSSLKQYIELTKDSEGGDPVYDGHVVRAKVGLMIHAAGKDIKTTVALELEPQTLVTRITSGEIAITTGSDFELFGMKGAFYDLGTSVLVDHDQLALNLGGSDPRLYLRAGVGLRLSFGKLSSGRPLIFNVTNFVMHGGGLDLDAELGAESTITLNGLETDFTFKAARLSVRDGKVATFALAATGKLPPAVLGDVDACLHVSFGMRGNSFVLIDGSIELVNKGKPIRSEQTHFVFTLDGLTIRAFENSGSIHFCAFISGSAQFKPEVAELADGMFKRLAGIELSFTDCPLCGASEVIERELRKLNLSFVVALDQPMRANLFDLFKFEVRSIGFEPNCKMFDDGVGALVIGGQCEFASVGDVVRAECDFHRIYIAPPSKGEFVPRIRCEGLGVAIRLGSAFEIEGKVVAVDGRMPKNVLETRPPDGSLKTNGFMGQGRIAIQGLPPMAASFGFVEVMRPEWASPKRAWFVFIEAQHLSYYFQLGPVPIYLREVGLGLGYIFTYVGIKEIDQAPDLISIIPKLDRIAEEAIEPAKLEAWVLDEEGESLTLVARAMISMSSASSPTEAMVWKPEQERELPNLLLLNATMAMRNSTFMMSAQAWLGWSYYDWDYGRSIGRNNLVGKQAMTGYIVLVGSRSEFLARLKSNKGGEIGPRLAIVDAFKDALKEVEFDATLYIRPGLFHMELGWPNRIRWTKSIGGANLTVAGGAIFRIHEESLLAGLNLEGRLDFSMSGSIDAGVVGIAVSASVYTSIVARIIGYLSARNVSESLYYSLFSLQVRIQFSVSAWLEIKTFFCKITIRASFSLSLQVDVLAELAIQGDGSVGTRVRATIAISVFGRSLGLSIGLALNTAIVDAAALRVARYMQLGLVQPVPEVSPPLAKQNEALVEVEKTGAERRTAQAIAASANNHADNLAKVPHEEELPGGFVIVRPIKHYPIEATDFHVIATYPDALPEGVKGRASEWVYLTFIPLEARDENKSSFYAAPHSTETTQVDHCVNFAPLKVTGDTDIYQWDSGWKAVPATATANIATSVCWKAELQYEESTETRGAGGATPAEDRATLRELFFACFRTEDTSASPTTPYFEPKNRPVATGKPERLPKADPTEAHLKQQQRYAAAISVDPADRRCHEARDFLLHKFITDLFGYAADPAELKFVHVLHVGLTFLVQRRLIEDWTDAPIGSITKRPLNTPAGIPAPHDGTWASSAPCRIFNPPKLTFEAERPSFDSKHIKTSDGKVQLDWELKWSRPEEIEHFLQYYEIRRWVDLPSGEAESDPIRVKRADADYQVDGKRLIIRGEWQFTDEFEDLTPNQKKELLESGNEAVVRYSITPVCVSNKSGRPWSDVVIRFGGWPALEAPREARAQLTIDPEPAATHPLAIKIEMFVEDTPIQGGVRGWRLILRPQDIIPSGQYGSDAETQRSLGGWLANSREVQSGDVVIDFAAGLGGDDNRVNLLIGPGHEKVPQILQRLTDTTNPRAWRILAQQVILEGDGTESGGEVLASSPTTEVKLDVMLLAKNLKDQKFIGVQPGSFEFIRQPDATEKAILQPVAANDLEAVDAGRAVLIEPHEGSGGVAGNRTQPVPHPDFSAVTRLKWNVIPPGTTEAGLIPYRMLAGFKVLRLDLDGAGTLPNSSADWTNARGVLGTRLADAEKLSLLPGEIGDVSNWKAAYPSRAARQRAGGTWYSESESYIEWPPLYPRVEPVPEPSRDLLSALMQHGVPDAIGLVMVREPLLPVEGGKAVIEAPNITWEFKLRLAVAEGIIPAREDSAWILKDNQLEFKGAQDIAAASLRSALRRLEASPTDRATRDAYSTADRRGWKLQFHCKFVPGKDKAAIELNTEGVALDYDRALHPLLETLIARMRRSQGGRLLDADRRPPPVLKAKNSDEFLNGTSDAQDPFGWLLLDRLGLGVTLRLFDSQDDRYLGFKDLKQQLDDAVNAIHAEDMHKEARQFLAVEYLLIPGALVQHVPFDQRPDGTEFYKEENEDESCKWLGLNALSMVRISVRPKITKQYEYRVVHLSASTPESTLTVPAPFEAMLTTDTSTSTIQSASDLAKLLLRGGREANNPNAELDLLIRTPAQFGNLGNKDLAPGVGDLGHDAFGRFAAIDWKVGEAPLQQSIARFTLLLGDVLREPMDDEDRKAIKDGWLKFNHRFFEHSGVPDLDFKYVVAFAATEANEPVMVAQDAYGRASVVMPEADGYAHQFAYAVRPQWRYQAMLEAAGHTVAEAVPPSTFPYVLATVERTAPVQPPALISLGRLQDIVWWDKDGKWSTIHPGEGAIRLGSVPGLSSVLLLPHHPERRIARANTPAQRNLMHAGEMFTQLGMPREPEWCKAFLGVLPPIPSSLEAADAPADEEALAHISALDPLVPFERSRLRIISYLPHWYRTIAAVAAGAASEVSKPAVAYLPEASSRLMLIEGKGKRSLVPDHPWAGRTTIDSGGAQLDLRDEVARAPVAHAAFVYGVALLRYRDTTDTITQGLWTGGISDVPDPGVTYQVDLNTPARPERGEPLPMTAPIGRIVRGTDSARGEFMVLPISRDFEIGLIHDETRHNIDLYLSPLGKPIHAKGLKFENLPSGVVNGANEELRVPGGWRLDWLGLLLDALSGETPATRLAGAATLWEKLVEDEIGVADEDPFFNPLPGIQLRRMSIAPPTTDAECAELVDAFHLWLLECGFEPAALQIANLVMACLASLFEAYDKGETKWLFPPGPLTFDVPWLPTGMIKPDSALVSLESIGRVRKLLPDLMTRQDVGILSVDEASRSTAETLWQKQKQRWLGGREILITAQRGDAVPLQLLPLVVAESEV